MNIHDTVLNADERALLQSKLREGEELLWAGRSGAAAPVVQAVETPSFWRRIFGGKRSVLEQAAAPCEYAVGAITNKRVLLLPPAGEPQEWFLMLGMIRAFEPHAAGTGSIILDYDLRADGERKPIGLLNIADAENVHTLLCSAIDAAYNASPWSV